MTAVTMTAITPAARNRMRSSGDYRCMTALLRRAGAGLACVLASMAALGLVLLVSAPGASAHVTASSSGAAQGGYGQITFTVPSESATSNTTKIVVQIPADTPIASVRTQPVPGWTAAIATQTLPQPVSIAGRDITTAVDTITWTATAGGLGPTEYQTFSFSGGPLPMSDTITFKAIQYYADGSQVSWIDVPAPGSTEEPDHPAPVVSLAAASTSGHDDASGSDASGASESDDSGTSGVAIAALVVGVVAVVLAAAAVVMARRPRH